MIRSYEWDGHINTWHLLRLLACTLKLLCRMRLDITPEPLKGAFSLTKKKKKNPKNPTKQRNWTVSKKKSVWISDLLSDLCAHDHLCSLDSILWDIWGAQRFLKFSLQNWYHWSELPLPARAFIYVDLQPSRGHRRIKFWVCWGRRMVQGWMLEPQVLHVIWFLKMIW